jgi:hypothetical protein
MAFPPGRKAFRRSRQNENRDKGSPRFFPRHSIQQYNQDACKLATHLKVSRLKSDAQKMKFDFLRAGLPDKVKWEWKPSRS